MDFSQGKRILPAFFNRVMPIFILLAAVLNLSAGSVRAEGEDPELTARGYAANALKTQVALKGADILAGQGVAVIYPLQGPFDSSGYLPFQYQCTAAGCFQCLEFILWLYDARLGYPYKWPGSFWNPYEMIGVVQIADQLAYKVETKLLSPENAHLLSFRIETDEEVHDLRLKGQIVYELPLDGGHAYGVKFLEAARGRGGEAAVESLDQTVDLLGLVNKLLVRE